jgi:hypothetical protein
MRAASGDGDVGEGLAPLNGDESRVDRRGFGPLDDVSLGTAERDAGVFTITGGAKPITGGQDQRASSVDRLLNEVDRQRQVRTMADGIATSASLRNSASRVSFR